ncbi:outer membrane protein [Tardiphaga alba]|nr:outer membrane beta-barrel protein [Tardiphaga alba]
MRSFLIAAAVFTFGQAAQAADLPFLRGSFQDGPVLQRPIWDGFYVGGQASYGSAVSNISPSFNAGLQSTYIPPVGETGQFNWPGLASPQDNSTAFGGFVGYNSQWDDVVIGLEANYIHGSYKTVTSAAAGSTDSLGTPLTTSSTATIKIDDFGSLRLRAGYVAGSFLPYAFVGVGAGNMVTDRSTQVSIGGVYYPPNRDTKSNLVYGYSAGLGVDVMLVGGLFMRAEYEYQRITAKDVDGNVNSGRVGLGYRF